MKGKNTEILSTKGLGHHVVSAACDKSLANLKCDFRFARLLLTNVAAVQTAKTFFRLAGFLGLGKELFFSIISFRTEWRRGIGETEDDP
ncbi:MAG: hypothetical protein Q4G52_01465 [Clostridia bacterium]|nr:hypothetical protein [Clostridia bacterium]